MVKGAGQSGVLALVQKKRVSFRTYWCVKNARPQLDGRKVDIMTLRELKDQVLREDKIKKVSSLKELMSTEAVVEMSLAEDSLVAVFNCGYVLYVSGKRRTFFPLVECGAYEYDSLLYKKSIFSEDIFENAEWHVRLIMEGEDRICNNQNKSDSQQGLVSYSAVSEEWEQIRDHSVDFMKDILEQERHELLLELLDLATEKQRNALLAYYEMQENLTAAARYLGIARQSCDELIKNGIRRIHREYAKKYNKDLMELIDIL